MTFSPNLFLSNINSKGGPIKNSRFEVVIPIPQAVRGNMQASAVDKLIGFFSDPIQNVVNNVSNQVNEFIFGSNPNDAITKDHAITRSLAMQCETAQLPGRTFATIDNRVYGPVQKYPINTTYSDMILTFVCTNDFYERKFFDAWMDSIIPRDTNNVRFKKGVDGTGGYTSDISIIQFDDSIKQVYATKLINAFPTSVNEMQLDWASDGYHKLTVNFTYEYYRSVNASRFALPTVQDMATAGLSGLANKAMGSSNIGGSIASGLNSLTTKIF